MDGVLELLNVINRRLSSYIGLCILWGLLYGWLYLNDTIHFLYTLEGIQAH